MAMDKSRYPADWEQISRRIRYERARGKCEWCGAPDKTFIQRWREDPLIWVWSAPDFAGDEDWYKATRVILTVHHMGAPKDDGMPGDSHDKMDVRDCNLVALCNRCHLLADLPHHVANARQTRLRKRQQAFREAGQGELWPQ